MRQNLHGHALGTFVSLPTLCSSASSLLSHTTHALVLQLRYLMFRSAATTDVAAAPSLPTLEADVHAAYEAIGALTSTVVPGITTHASDVTTITSVSLVPGSHAIRGLHFTTLLDAGRNALLLPAVSRRTAAPAAV